MIVFYAALVMVGIGAAALFLGRQLPGCAMGSMMDLELARTVDRAAAILAPCEDGARAWTAVGGHLQTGISAFALLAGTFSYVCWYVLQRLEPRTAAGRSLFALGVLAGPLGLAFAIVESFTLWRLVSSVGANEGAALWTLALTLAKYLLFAFSAAVAADGLLRVLRQADRTGGDAKARLYEPPEEAKATFWGCASAVPDGESKGLGIAFSGGGIRSASFGMGALQVLQERPFPPQRDRSVFDNARYISAVSGGSYLAGARQILAANGVAQPFGAGTHEVEYVRRHGRYLADTASEWLSAIALLIAGLVVNLSVLWLLLFAVARPFGWLHARVWPGLVDAGRDAFADPALLLIIAVPAALAITLLLWAVMDGRTHLAQERFTFPFLLWHGAALLACVSAVVGIIAVFVPIVTMVGKELFGNDGVFPAGESVAAGGTVILTAILSFVRAKAPARAAIEHWLLKGQAADTSDADSAGSLRFPRVGKAARRGATTLLLVLVGLVFANLVEDAAVAGMFGRHRFFGMITLPDLTVAALNALGLFVLWLFADQTSWSLHPLYKRRLAEAFALGPKKNKDGSGVEPGVEPLRYEEPTTLSEWAKRRPGEPELIVCAAANMSGTEIAPPGRRAVTFTFGSDWVGGPQVGYIRTEDFEAALAKRHRGDTTLLGAMAISGAAFASAMGRHSRRGLQPLVATANLRLGVWLPSPSYASEVAPPRDVSSKKASSDAVSCKGAPAIRVRPFTYLLREIFGVYDPGDRLLYLTDGGHYENLGLVELLRRRCSTIICFDASGGPGTLVDAMRLAYEELGAKIHFNAGVINSVRTKAEKRRVTKATGDHNVRAKTGKKGLVANKTGHNDADPSERNLLEARFADGDVIRGTITYSDGETGTLVYARAVLTEGIPDTVRLYAEDHLRFPHDPTGDQWFDVEQFNNYLLLGRWVAEHAVDLLEESELHIAAKPQSEKPPPPVTDKDLPAAASRVSLVSERHRQHRIPDALGSPRNGARSKKPLWAYAFWRT